VTHPLGQVCSIIINLIPKDPLSLVRNVLVTMHSAAWGGCCHRDKADQVDIYV
jgi:hypothetical protein